MNLQDMKPGMRVVTRALRDTKGMVGLERWIPARVTNGAGTVRNYVPSHGGDVWIVDHDGGSVAVYWYTELEKER